MKRQSGSSSRNRNRSQDENRVSGSQNRDIGQDQQQSIGQLVDDVKQEIGIDQCSSSYRHSSGIQQQMEQVQKYKQQKLNFVEIKQQFNPELLYLMASSLNRPQKQQIKKLELNQYLQKYQQILDQQGIQNNGKFIVTVSQLLWKQTESISEDINNLSVQLMGRKLEKKKDNNDGGNSNIKNVNNGSIRKKTKDNKKRMAGQRSIQDYMNQSISTFQELMRSGSRIQQVRQMQQQLRSESVIQQQQLESPVARLEENSLNLEMQDQNSQMGQQSLQSLQKMMDGQDEGLILEQADQMFNISRKDIAVYDDNLIDIGGGQQFDMVTGFDYLQVSDNRQLQNSIDQCYQQLQSEHKILIENEDEDEDSVVIKNRKYIQKVKVVDQVSRDIQCNDGRFQIDYLQRSYYDQRYEQGQSQNHGYGYGQHYFRKRNVNRNKMEEFLRFYNEEIQLQMEQKINQQEIVNIDLNADDNFHFTDINRPISVNDLGEGSVHDNDNVNGQEVEEQQIDRIQDHYEQHLKKQDGHDKQIIQNKVFDVVDKQIVEYLREKVETDFGDLVEKVNSDKAQLFMQLLELHGRAEIKLKQQDKLGLGPITAQII